MSLARLQASGAPLLDLTMTNPTRVGLPYPPDLVMALGDPRGLAYEPHPFGAPLARAAVAAECERHGFRPPVEHVVLTASTSEAYSYLFKLLCDHGDRVLVPAPSYPLFEHLASLDGICLETYPLEYHGVWSIDCERLGGLLDGARAVVVVTPNNPTGSYVRRDQWHWLRALCAAHEVALICDEVFIDYPLEPAGDAVRSVLADESSARGDSLIVSLGGLSKSIGLPQHKLGWMVLQGAPAVLRDACERLEFIGDSYLSVGTPVQVALPRLLEAGASVRAAIAQRVMRNLHALQVRLNECPATAVLRAEAGWSAVLRLPAVGSEESLVEDLLERDQVLVHPGFFFDFPAEAYVVVSLLPPPDVFDAGVDRLCRRVAS
jgi:aspartate/methionine/tyrosine aminotransferase